MSERSTLRDGLRRLLSSYLFYVLIGVVVGAQLAPYALPLGLQQTVDRGTVAVVPLQGTIDGGTASEVAAELRAARSDSDVEAVVVVVNSPGGGAAASETLYLAMQRTADQLPLVVSVASSAASGAYYASVPADEIYAKPASLVGSVGTYAMLPPQIEPIDYVVATGPGKLRGGDARDWQYRIQAVQRAFLRAVMQGRGDRLELSREAVSQAKIYAGSAAVENGLVDAIGDEQAAVQAAASRAGLESYRTETFAPNTTATFVSRSAYLGSSAERKRLVDPSTVVSGDGPAAMPNLLLLPGSVVTAGVSGNATVTDDPIAVSGGDADG